MQSAICEPAPGSEVELYYDHRHDDYVAGLKLTGIGSGQTGEFLLTIPTAQSTDLSVAYAVKGSGVNGTDYVYLKGTAKIKSGRTQKPVKVTPLGDLDGASKKTVVLVLELGNGYTVGTSGKVKVKILAGQ